MKGTYTTLITLLSLSSSIAMSPPKNRALTQTKNDLKISQQTESGQLTTKRNVSIIALIEGQQISIPEGDTSVIFPPQRPPQTNTTINNNNNVNNESSSASTTFTHISNQNSLSARFHNMLQQMHISPPDIRKSLQEKWNLHKKKISLLLAAGVYLSICAHLIRGNRFVHKTTTWASWKRQLSLEELHEFSQDQLGKDLIHAIQVRHVNVNNPTDHITPLVRFVREVEKEMRILNRYIMVAQTICTCRLSWFFPTNRTKLNHALEARQRLTFVKHVFVSWAATDNLANFNH